MMAASPEQKFNAAVKVIRGLPKNGSFQPSHELMLKFYAYFKQATEGPCTAPKPGIWNLVSRKKWEAWAGLGEMDRERAMLLYVEELKNIVETMPQTEQVAEFVETLGTFYELIDEGNKPKQPTPNGSANFDETDKLEHSSSIGQMLKINNNDNKKDDDDDDRDPSSRPGATINGHGEDHRLLGNGELEEKESEGEEEDDDDDDEKKSLDDSLRVESGSDTDEFCDTTDQLIQLPTQLPTVTSTPIDAKRENRVRFAAHVQTHNDSFSMVSDDDETDSTLMLHNLSSSNQQMLSDRLALGTAIGGSFLTRTLHYTPHSLSESLRVNNSFSSLASLAGNDSVAGDVDVLEENIALDDVDVGSHMCAADIDMSEGRGREIRGGEDDTSSQTSGGVCSSHSAGAGSGARGGRGLGRSTSDSSGRMERRSGSGQGQGGGGHGGRGGRSVEEEILLALIRMQQDMTDISHRLAALELCVQQQREEQAKKSRKSVWWLFTGVSKTTFFLIVVWPFLAPLIINLIWRQRRRSPR